MKIFFTLFLSVLSISLLNGQNLQPDLSKTLSISSGISQEAVPIGKKMLLRTIAEPVNEQLRNDNPVVNPTAVFIGLTTYDIQTNRSGCNRIYNVNDTVGASWNMSQQLISPVTDRGTGTNFYDGNWSAVPSSWIDTVAWSNIDMKYNIEYMVGHNRLFTPYDLVLLKRTPAGAGVWNRTYLPPHPNGNTCIWSRMRVGGLAGTSVHVIALTLPTESGGTILNGINGALTYSRSQDGGNSWNQIHVALPMMDAVHYASIQADSYALDVYGNTVVISQGSMYNDWVIWKSTDDGSTWTRTVIWPFPIAAYDVNTMNTDIDGDMVADTIEFLDGNQAVLIDNNGMVHCWMGRMQVLQEPGNLFSYFPHTDGLYYWNENFGISLPLIAAIATDIDANGIITIEPDVASYESSLTSMPSAGVDASNNIYVAFSSIKENTTSGGSPSQSYRNVYCMASPDNGVSWTPPVSMSDSDFDEGVYPSIARNVDPLHLIFQQDATPGVANGGPVTFNDIVHISDEPANIFSALPVTPLNYKQVKGMVYVDLNQNGQRDINEYGILGFAVNQSPANSFTATSLTGNFSFLVIPGTHTISIQTGPDWQITSDSTTYTITITNATIDSLDFGIAPVTTFLNLSSSLVPGVPRCNNFIDYSIVFQNTGTVPASGTVSFIKDPQLTYDNAMPPFSSMSGDTISWNFTNLLPFQLSQASVNFSSTGLFFGDTIINCEDINFTNGASTGLISGCVTQPVLCAWDPNDKLVAPEGIDVPHYTLLSDTLIYTIRFQNTGTDVAYNIKLRDTLDASLDPASFRFIGSSHPVDILRKSNGAMLFSFNNILLPDSGTNLTESNGFFNYSVLPKPATPSGTVVYNTAHIFFDYNEPIVTNTTFNTLVNVIGLVETTSPEFQVSVAPNPFRDETVISFSNPNSEVYNLIIRDLTGKEITRVKNHNGSTAKLSLPGSSSGMYFLIVENMSGIVYGVKKLIVE